MIEEPPPQSPPAVTHFQPPSALPSIPDVDEDAVEAEPSEYYQPAVRRELYPSHPPPSTRTKATTESSPPVIDRTTKPTFYSESLKPSVNSTLHSSKPPIDYSRKPSLDLDNPPTPTPTPMNLPSEAPWERSRPPVQHQKWPQPAAASPGYHDDHSSTWSGDTEPTGSKPSLYEAQSPITNQTRPVSTGVREHYDDIRPSAYPQQPHVQDNVEERRFRQMHPVPHEFYMQQATGRNPDRVYGRSSEPLTQRDRASSGRSFTSQSSADSTDNLHSSEKQLPIRIPGRRHLSSDASPVAELPPTKPISLREATRIMGKGGLVNPSYRVAIDMMPPSKQQMSGRPRLSPNKPTPSKRQGGLPTHVRHGIDEGV